MKIQESKLRKIIREEIGLSSDMDNLMADDRLSEDLQRVARSLSRLIAARIEDRAVIENNIHHSLRAWLQRELSAIYGEE